MEKGREGGRGRGPTPFHLLMCSGCMEGGWKEGGGFLCQQVCHSLGEGEWSGVEGDVECADQGRRVSRSLSKRGRLQRPQRPLACFPSPSLPLMPRSAFIASSLDLNGGMGWEQTAEAESWRRTISRKKETVLILFLRQISDSLPNGCSPSNVRAEGWEGEGGSPKSIVQISCNVGESVVADEGVGVREGVFLNA